MERSNNTERKRIMLGRIRSALAVKTPPPFPLINTKEELFSPFKESIEVDFSRRFIKNGGNFIFCENINEFLSGVIRLAEMQGLNHVYCWDKPIYESLVDKGFRKCHFGKNLDRAEACITKCEVLIGRTGSIVFSSALESKLQLTSVAPLQIVLGYSSQIVWSHKRAIQKIYQKYGEKWPRELTITTGKACYIEPDYKVRYIPAANSVYLFLLDDL